MEDTRMAIGIETCGLAAAGNWDEERNWRIPAKSRRAAGFFFSFLEMHLGFRVSWLR
jgi:hypothetical protein